jgi:enamine deaminase RidA (YjgF/YER057c/UK114 family)
MSAGTRAGQLLFLAPQTPVDPERGALVRHLRDLPPAIQGRLATGRLHPDMREGGVWAQTWQVYENLRRLLEANGSSLDGLVRQRVYLKAMRDVSSVERVLLELLPADRLPATTFVQLPAERGAHPEISIVVEAIALASGELQKQTIYVPGLERVTAPYPQAVRVGQLLFLSALTGVDPASGRVVTSVGELPTEAREVLSGRTYSDGREDVAAAQTWLLLDHARRVTESQGSSMDEIAKQNMFMTLDMREFTTFERVRRPFYGGPKGAPPSTAVQVGDLGSSREAVIAFELIAVVPPADPEHLAPGEIEKRRVGSPVLGDVQAYGHGAVAVRAGSLLFAAGDVGLDQRTGNLILSAADLPDRGAGLSDGRTHADAPILAQSWHVYQQFAPLLEANGASFDSVLQQNFYLRDLRQAPSVERVASFFYGSRLPPTMAIPILDISPYDECVMEIEVTALSRDGQQGFGLGPADSR